MTLVQLIEDPPARAAFVDACVRAVEEEVRSKSGLSGMAIKAGYAAFQRVKPGMTRAGVVRLLPEMAPVLDGLWARGGADPHGWLLAHPRDAAEALLGVTDSVADRSRHTVLVKMYRSLRGSAHDHVTAGVPRLAGLLRNHLG